MFFSFLGLLPHTEINYPEKLLRSHTTLYVCSHPSQGTCCDSHSSYLFGLRFWCFSAKASIAKILHIIDNGCALAKASGHDCIICSLNSQRHLIIENIYLLQFDNMFRICGKQGTSQWPHNENENWKEYNVNCVYKLMFRIFQTPS